MWHCGQCRRTSGHVWASIYAPSFDAINFIIDNGLTWYDSSGYAKRGFCNKCGSSPFYRMNGETGVGIAAGGGLDQPTGMKTTKHIFVKDKGDDYEITENLPQIATY